MDQETLKTLIQQGEGQNLEFKLRPSEEIGKDICAFTNTNDGTIIVGISNSKDLIGTTTKMESQVASISHSCKPAIYPEIEQLKIEAKSILVIRIKKTGGIHSYKNIAYKRVGSHNKPLSPDEVIEFAKSTGKIQFDSQICQGVTLKDIDEERVKWFLKKAKAERNLGIDPSASSEEALRKLNLIADDKFTNTAILMFGKNPQRTFIQSEVRCAHFKGTKAVKPFIDMKVIGGSVYEQIDQAEKFVLFNIKKAAWVDPGKIERQEKWEYPPDAIREAITNAIAHRDYYSSANVHISIFNDRIEVWNPGKLPPPLTPKDLKKEHKSIPTNPSLANLLFLIKYIERWGTGTNDIVKWCVEYKLPEPLFKEVMGGFTVILRKYKITESLESSIELNERQWKAVEFLKEKGKITNREYVNLLQGTISGDTALNDLRDMVEKGIISIKRKGRSSYYVIR